MRTRLLAVAFLAAGLTVGGCKKNSTDSVSAPPQTTTTGDAMPAGLAAPAQPVAGSGSATGAGTSGSPRTAGGTAGANMGGHTHTVAAKETLWSIAQQEYGDGKRWQDIAKANGNIDPKSLKVGQVLTLP